MKRAALPLIIIIVFISCKGNTDKNAQQAEKPAAVVTDTVDASGCYRMVISKDTAYMELTATGDSLQGPLSYRRFEKDSNAGIVRMKLNGDRASGWYIFQAEGKTSYREIVFEYKGNNFAEGYGDTEMKGDSAMFKYPQTLRFEENHPFIRVPCK